jgi:hypothetical protein
LKERLKISAKLLNVDLDYITLEIDHWWLLNTGKDGFSCVIYLNYVSLEMKLTLVQRATYVLHNHLKFHLEPWSP